MNSRATGRELNADGHRGRRAACAASALLAWGLGLSSPAEIPEEFRIKRQETFEFAEKPTAARDGDKVTIRFASKASCDATVAIEDTKGKIIRHVASGVLGPNAPAPLQKDSLSQTLIWDGKNDQGTYLDDKDSLTVRVSLGLKPRFERSLYWSPKKRAAQALGRAVAMQSTPEGVYVYDGGQAVDHVRLFDHAGEYLRTIYPFPAGKINDVKGLIWHEFPQDGKRLPIKPSYQMCTLLTSGNNALNIIFDKGRYFYGPMDPAHKGENGYASTDIAVAAGRIALAANRLNRLATDGSSGGLPVYGPHVDQRNEKGMYRATESAMTVGLGGYDLLTNLRAQRFALSPDGKTLYLTRYIENYSMDMYRHNYWQHGVYRMDFEGDKEPVLFLGDRERGSDDSRFSMPADVACDSKGRVYVADCGNNRVQVFLPDGKLVTSIPVESPAQLAISPKTGEVYVFSWELLSNRNFLGSKPKRPFVLRKFKSVDDPKLLATFDLPMASTTGMYEQCADVDFWAEPTTIWVSPGRVVIGRRGEDERTRPAGILVLAEKGGSLEVIRDFERDAREAITEAQAPANNRQRLYWEPKRELLYVGEGPFHFQEAVTVDPASGKTKVVQIPFDAEDMCFDSDGLAYLRTPGVVARYDPVAWREVPWDYGEERQKVTYNSNSGRREAHVVSGLTMPATGWHQGGMHVSPKGNLVVGCLYVYGPQERIPNAQPQTRDGKSYAPQLYPGRVTMSAYGAEYIHVWDSHGKLIYEDAIPGLGTLNGVAIDNEEGLYVLSAAPRVYDGKPHFNFLAGTVMKFRPNKGRLLSDSDRNPIPLPAGDRPQRSADLSNLPGNAWAEKAEWFYGGVGWHGKNHGLGCGCRNTRFALDYFGRSFAPEVDRYSVAVLDTAGNVILRVGQYGNVDDGVPAANAEGTPGTAESARGTPGDRTPRSIGGDEVAIMHGAYVATQTDRRLFIADIGNYRIASVRLDYHVTEKVALKQ